MEVDSLKNIYDRDECPSKKKKKKTMKLKMTSLPYLFCVPASVLPFLNIHAAHSQRVLWHVCGCNAKCILSP